jgi:Flp pilus assembly CpaF family ATPase
MKKHITILLSLSITIALNSYSQTSVVSNYDTTKVYYQALKIYLDLTQIKEKTINIESENTIVDKLPGQIENFHIRNLLKEDIASELRKNNSMYLVRLDSQTNQSDDFIVSIERFHVTKQKRLFFYGRNGRVRIRFGYDHLKGTSHVIEVVEYDQ